jgi:hypothetical protein
VHEGQVRLDLEDQIIREALVTHDGKVVHPKVAELIGASPVSNEVSR